MSMKHIGTKILAGVLVVLLAGAGVLIWRNLPEDAPRLQEPEETVRQEPEVQPTPQRPCAWRAILWRTCRLSRMRGTAKRMILRTCSRMQGGITRLRITQRPVWRPRSTVRRIRATRSSRTELLASGRKRSGFTCSPRRATTAWIPGTAVWSAHWMCWDAAGLEHVGTYRTQQERDTVKIIDVGGIKLPGWRTPSAQTACRWTASTRTASASTRATT